MKMRRVSNADLFPNLCATQKYVSKSRRNNIEGTANKQLGRRKGNRCNITGKIRYRDVGQAKKSLQRSRNAKMIEIENLGTSNRQETRYFYCAKCKGYHLTSQRENVIFDVFRISA